MTTCRNLPLSLVRRSWTCVHRVFISAGALAPIDRGLCPYVHAQLMKLASGRHCPVYTRVIVTPWAHNVHYFWCNVTATGKLDVYTSTMSETPESFQLSCTRYSCRPILTTNSHFLGVYERYTLEWRYLSLTFWHCRTWDDCDLWLRLIRTLQAKLLVLIKSSHFSHSCVHMFSFASSTHMRKKLRVRSYLKLIHRGSRSDVCLVKYCFTHVMICTKFGNSFFATSQKSFPRN